MDSTASRHYFSPPLYMQRYQFIIDMVKRIRPRTVMDLGCADCSLLRKLRFHRNGIEVLVGVDIDASVVRKEMHALAPLSSDYLQPNDRPLTIKLYQGSVTEKEPCTTGFDLVTCVELIEHLQLMEVKAFSEVVFEHMAPGTVIVSTPNVEFNPLLPGLTGFRHNNHKFEWTRAEFQAWSYGVCQEYGYSVEFSGVGEAPEQAIDVGFCSQIAVFSRQHHASGRDVGLEPVVYTLLYEVDYPSLTDNNIFQRLLVNEALYAAENLKRQWLEGIPSTRTTESNPAEEESSNSVVRPLPYRLGDYICVPLASIWFCPKVKTLCRTVQCLQERLLDDSKIQLSNDGEAVVLAADEEEEEEEEEELENEDAPLGAWEGPAAPSQDEDWEAELWSDLT